MGCQAKYMWKNLQGRFSHQVKQKMILGGGGYQTLKMFSLKIGKSSNVFLGVSNFSLGSMYKIRLPFQKY